MSKKGQNGADPGGTGMPAKSPSLQRWLELQRYMNKKGEQARVQGLLWGKGFQADKIVHAKVLRWTVPTFLKNGHTA